MFPPKKLKITSPQGPHKTNKQKTILPQDSLTELINIFQNYIIKMVLQLSENTNLFSKRKDTIKQDYLQK